MSENDTTQKIRRQALNMLARRDYSAHELSQKLKMKGYAESDIKTVMTNLIQKGLLNETRYTENFIYSRRRKGYGPERISKELELRGINIDVIAEQIEITDNAWFVEARRVLQKHFKSKPPSNFHERAKQMRFLHYRGFTSEQIKAAVGGEENVNE